MNVLIGDIGGTKTILAVFSSEAGPHKPLAEMTYPSLQYADLETIINEFLHSVNYQVQGACFGVAGPVIDGGARITNLPWMVDGEKIKAAFKFDVVNLINDLESVAYSIGILEPEDIYTLNAGEVVKNGSVAVLAPGTGLGEAYLTCYKGSYYAHASEGSHASFAPVNQTQIDLLSYMFRQGYKHVSFENVCSGRLGIPHLYQFLKSTGAAPEPAWLAEKLASSSDPTPVIFRAAQDKERPSDLASATIRLFVDILGSEAGNLALKILSTGGIYLGGGISPRILPYLQEPSFMEAVRNKGRFREVLTKMPVRVILNSKAGLMGAAAHGLDSLS